MNRRTGGRLAVTTAALVTLGACGDGAAADVADKTGGETIVLRMATIDGDVANNSGPAPQTFVDSLTEISGGRLQVDVTTSFGDGDVEGESRLVEAIASGELDGGWPATRAFAAAGIEGLEAVEAPMTISSYAAAKELVAGPVADSVIAPLDGTGVVGLGLAVSDLRRPLASESPLLSPDDWHGIRFRSFNSPTQSAAISALGAEPVDLYSGWQEQVEAGLLRGIEGGVAMGPASNITGNVVLWPKILVFSLSQKRFDALSHEQREWLQQAADRARQASIDETWDETAKAAQVCEEGGRIVDATAEQLAGLQAAWRPMIDELAADPESGPLMAEIQLLADKHPVVDVLQVPASCRLPLVERSAPEFVVPDEPSALPEGIYRVEITLDEVRSAGLNNNNGLTGLWSLIVEDGTYQLTCRLIDLPDRDCGTSGIAESAYEAGQLLGTGQTVYFNYDVEMMSELIGCSLPIASNATDSCHAVDPYSMTWELDGDLLTFSRPSREVEGAYLLEPWEKID